MQTKLSSILQIHKSLENKEDIKINLLNNKVTTIIIDIIHPEPKKLTIGEFYQNYERYENILASID